MCISLAGMKLLVARGEMPVEELISTLKTSILFDEQLLNNQKYEKYWVAVRERLATKKADLETALLEQQLQQPSVEPTPELVPA